MAAEERGGAALREARAKRALRGAKRPPRGAKRPLRGPKGPLSAPLEISYRGKKIDFTRVFRQLLETNQNGAPRSRAL